MRILALTTAYHPHLGGAELAMQDVARHLPDDEIVVLAARRDRRLPRTETVEGRTVRRLGIGHPVDRHLFALLAPVAAWRLGREAPFDAAWAMMANQAAFAALFTRILLGIPYLLTLQEGHDDAWFATRARSLGFAYRAVFRFADAIQPISQFLASRARSFDPSAPVCVVPNGADLEVFAPASPEEVAATRADLGVAYFASVLVTASRLAHKNGIDLVLDALPLLPGTALVVAGSGPDAGALRARAARLGVADRVFWLGDIRHGPALARVLAAGDLFIRPSRSEGLGTAFIEAMACGLPVVATRVGGIPDVVPPEAGALLDTNSPPEAIATACTRVLAARLSHARAALSASERFAWGALAGAIRAQLASVAQPRRILVATGVYPPESGGPATYVATLQRELPGRGVSLSVYPFRWVRRLPPGVRHAAYALGLLLRARGTHALFAQDPVSVGLPAALVAGVSGKPLALKVVGDYAWEQAVNRFGCTDLLDDFVNREHGVRPRLLAFLERRVARVARAVVTPSRYLDSVVARWGVPKKRRRVIYNGIALPELPERDATRAAQGWEGIVAISVGRLVPWKNVPETVRAVGALRDERMRLEVVGDGPDRAAVERAVAASGARVTLHGALTRDATLALTAAADICVLNTAYEGFSHQLLEAFALGVASVTTAAGGNAEIVRDGENALVVPLGDPEALSAAIARLSADPALRARLGAQTRKDARRFSVRAMCDEIADVLTTL